MTRIRLETVEMKGKESLNYSGVTENGKWKHCGLDSTGSGEVLERERESQKDQSREAGGGRRERSHSRQVGLEV